MLHNLQIVGQIPLSSTVWFLLLLFPMKRSKSSYVSLTCFISLLPVMLQITRAQTSSSIRLGSSMAAGDGSKWVSPSGNFALGFHRVGDEDQFLLAIWFDKITERTVVWFANGDHPVQQGSQFSLTIRGQLLLVDHGGRQIWSRGSNDGNTASAEILDTGNFALKNGNSSLVWQSFDEPKDTILPTQILQEGQNLSCRFSQTNFSTGRFGLTLLKSGTLMLHQGLLLHESNHSNAYWRNNIGNGSKLVLSTSGSLYIEAQKRQLPYLAGADPDGKSDDLYHKATLDFDGVLRLYKYSEYRNPNKPWMVVAATPTDICYQGTQEEGIGVCGANSYCKLEEEYRPSCFCPPAYVYSDPNNSFRGCKPGFSGHSCDSNGAESAEFELTPLPDADWPHGDYDSMNGVTEEDCRNHCMSDCECAAAVFRGGECRKKKLPFTGGWINGAVGGVALFKVPIATKRKTAVTPTKKKHFAILMGVSLAGLFMVVMVIIGVLTYCRKKQTARNLAFLRRKSINSSNVDAFLEKHSSFSPKEYRHSEIKRMTSNFEEKLGGGGFGSVFKGQLSDGRLVAVKVLNESTDDGEDFINEVSSMSKAYHVNIVRLLGFCSKRGRRALVYEFMPNGSLDKFIYLDKVSGTTHFLGWDKLHEITVGIARGLEYLHRWCNTPILHFDMKPQNILLDKDFCPKISDFGLSKVCPGKGSLVSMQGARGTVGYIAPEVHCKNFRGVSHKSDVYSYGMMVLEMVGGRKNFSLVVENSNQIYFPNYIYKCLEQQGQDLGLQGEFIVDADEETAKKLIVVGLWCIQLDPSKRPSMSRVVELLEGRFEDIEMPPRPFLTSPPPQSLEASCGDRQLTTSISAKKIVLVRGSNCS